MTNEHNNAAQTDWRELCRRLYVELWHCNKQMTGGPRPRWTQGSTVRDVLRDASLALEATPASAPAPAVPPLLSDERVARFFGRLPENVNKYEARLVREIEQAVRAQFLTAPSQEPYKDGTPQLSVEESSFEFWYAQYLLAAPVHQESKQRARDAYAAGMADPLVTAAPSQKPVNRPQNCGTGHCSCIECVCKPSQLVTDEWCYSFDEERFHGDCASREEAIAEAKAEAEGDEHTHAWIGKSKHPREFISKNWLGEAIYEYISERLGDEVGEVAECFVLKPEEKNRLGAVVISWIEAGPGFRCWAVKDVEMVDLADFDENGQVIAALREKEGGV